MAMLPRIEALLERQAKLAEVRDRLIEEGGRAHLARVRWITLSRQLGSGGAELAGRLADELQWQVYDREILSAIAQHTHTREVILSWLERETIGPMTDYLARVLEPQNPGRVPFLQEMARVICGIAHKGSAVIVGRGANWLLGSEGGLRLRVVASIDQRIRRIAERAGCDEAAARDKAGEHDAQRRTFIRQTYGQSIDDPLGYDLTLNLGSLSFAAATRAVIGAVHGKAEKRP